MVLGSLILDNLISCNWVYRHKSSWTWVLTTITKLVGCKSGLLCYFQVDIVAMDSFVPDGLEHLQARLWDFRSAFWA